MLSSSSFFESTESVSSSVGTGYEGFEDSLIMLKDVFGAGNDESYDRPNS